MLRVAWRNAFSTVRIVPRYLCVCLPWARRFWNVIMVHVRSQRCLFTTRDTAFATADVAYALPGGGGNMSGCSMAFIWNEKPPCLKARLVGLGSSRATRRCVARRLCSV